MSVERSGGVTVTGGEFHMDAEVRIVEVERGRVTVEFDGRRTDVLVGESLTLHLTGTVDPPEASSRSRSSTPLVDLKKAQWYLNREIERRGG